VTSATFIRMFFMAELFRWPVTLHLVWKDRWEKTGCWNSGSKFAVAKLSNN